MFAIYELIELFPASYTPALSPQLNALFDLLRTEKLDSKAAKDRFLEPHQSDKYFNKIKNKLKSNLINQLMVSPPTWANTPQKKLCDSCHKSFAAYKILLASGRRAAAIDLAKKLLPKVQKLEIQELIYTIASDLEYHYSANNGPASEVKKYTNLADQQLKIITAERLVRSCHGNTTLLYNTKNSFSPSTIEIFKSAVEQTLPYLKLKSDKLNRLIYNIIVMRYYVIYDYSNIINYCDKALKSFDPNHPSIASFRFAFLQKKVTALVALSQLEKAKIIAKEAAQLVEPGKFNWHLIILQRIEVCFHAGSFQEAYELYKAHEKFPCNDELLIEYWNIIRAYLYFLIQVGHIKPYAEERFNLGKFLNEIPIYAQDKAGLNINILIIQILIEMQREQFGRIIDRIEALHAYARKHTRRVETVRAYIFIHMIVIMESASFHRKATERKTQKLLQRLKNKPLKMGQNLTIELIPYEVLWNEILELLDNKFRARKINKSKSNKNI